MATNVVDSSSRTPFRVGDWEVHPRSCRLVRNGTEIKLSPRSMDVLVYLAERAGIAVTHDELLDAFWRGTISTPNAIQKCVVELRHAFGNGGGEPQCIETVPKRGYRLVASVAALETANGTGGSENEAKQQLEVNGSATESSKPAPEPPANASAAVPRRSRKRTFALAFLAAVALVSAFALLLVNRTERFVVRIGDQSAVLLPIDSSSSAADRRSLAEVRDRIVGQFRANGRAEVVQTDRTALLAAADGSASAWRVDYALQIGLEESADRVRASLSIIPAQSDAVSHHEEFEVSTADRSTLVDTIVTHAMGDLAVLLDREQLAQMHEWGTENVDAYRYAREGNTFRLIPTTESLARAEEMFRLSIAEDARFGYGYVSLSSVYSQLSQDAPDSTVQQLQRTKLIALLREATAAQIDQKSLSWIERDTRDASISSAFDSEKLCREELLKNPTDAAALQVYSQLLVGAKLVDEGQRYLDRALAQPVSIEAKIGIKSWYSTLALARGNFEEHVRLNKEALEKLPGATLALWGTVRSLAHLGRFQEAQTYVDQLVVVDPAWGSAAEDVLRAWHGDTPLGSADLRAALADPQRSNGLKGTLCFTLGDVECGVHWWRRIEPTFLRLLWSSAALEESTYPRSVVDDPRFQALLEELGIGRTWRAYMRQQAQALASVTGIPVTTPPSP